MVRQNSTYKTKRNSKASPRRGMPMIEGLLVPVNNELVLKPINELLSESFFIPSYQRGYRWTQRQVIELLDDISEFQKQNEDSPSS
jgi:hypothetical protein